MPEDPNGHWNGNRKLDLWPYIHLLSVEDFYNNETSLIDRGYNLLIYKY